MPDHLIVIRAGATDYDLEERIRGTLDMPLSAAGVAAATRAGNVLAEDPPAVIYASADEAAEEIRDTQPRLHRQWQDNPWSVAPPEGELLEEACERVEAVLEKIFKRHASGTVAVVVPRPLDAVVTWLVSGRSMGDRWRFDADADLVDVLPVAAQWQPPRPGAVIAHADGLEQAAPQPFVSR